MSTELETMESNNNESIQSLPKGKHFIGCKWIYEIKYNSSGTIERYKACLAVKGHTQQEGLDFIETFSPVAKLVTIKLLLVIVAVNGWPLIQLDINNAF